MRKATIEQRVAALEAAMDQKWFGKPIGSLTEAHVKNILRKLIREGKVCASKDTDDEEIPF